jgi:hypothetical protein
LTKGTELSFNPDHRDGQPKRNKLPQERRFYSRRNSHHHCDHRTIGGNRNPQFISYRSRAIDAQLKSDLRNAAVAVESYFAKWSSYPASVAQIQGYGFQPTDGVTLTITVVTPNSYSITATKPGGTQPSFTFTSSTGSIN